VRVVANASPLINLARIGRLDLLRKLYGELLIPEAVWQETVIAGAGEPGADQIRDAPWIKVLEVANRALVAALRQDLDAGEAEAIALALETQANFLLMDERIGRETALHLGVGRMGLIGVLVEAKNRGLVDLVRPFLDALRDTAGFRVSDMLYARVLRDQGEA